VRSAKLLVIFLAIAFAAPLLIGLLGTALPAFGFMPRLAPGDGFSELFADPRFWPSLWLTLKTGTIATLVVFLVTVLTLVSMHGTRLWRALLATLPPLLAVPHAAMAIGIAFLLAPSGWLARVMSPWATGWQRPSDLWFVPDADGWSLIVALVLKETPFLVLTAAAQLSALNVDANLQIGRTLGYSPARCWSRLILPRLYPRIRLTLLIILAFNLSVVDMALLIGPGNPPTFAVMLMSIVNDPESRAAASAGALLLALGVLLIFGIYLSIERLLANVASRRRISGWRGHGSTRWRQLGRGAVFSLLVISVLALVMLPLWSLTRRWRFPDALPSQWTIDHWISRGDLLTGPLTASALLMIVTMVLAVSAAISWLEVERRIGLKQLDWLWYIPLLVPQVSLMFGWQAAALSLSVDGQWLTVVYGHWVYALPYVMLILAVAFREYDRQWDHAASTLGAGYWRVLWQVRLPILARPLCQAAAVAGW